MRPRKIPLDRLDIYIDHPVSKSQLATYFGVARSTLGNWENLAFWRLPSFREAYPQLDNSRDRTAPLSPYQAWVLSRVGDLILRLGRLQRVRAYIDNNQHEFARYRFEKIHRGVN